MSPAKFNSITAVINGANKKLWKHTEEQCIFEGWKIVNCENLCTTNKLYQYLTTYKINTIVVIRGVVACKKSFFEEFVS